MTGANANQGKFDQWILAQGRQRICILSPHLDDGVYSAFAAITCPLPVYREVVTVITETGSDGASVWGNSAGFSSRREEFEARREEDRRVLGNLGVDCRHLGAQEGDRDSIRTAVMNAISTSDPDTLFLIPAGAGTARSPGAVRRLMRRLGRKPAGSAAHPEHLIVRDAAIEVLKSTRGFGAAFYAEQPYLWNDTTAQDCPEPGGSYFHAHCDDQVRTRPGEKDRVRTRLFFAGTADVRHQVLVSEAHTWARRGILPG